MVVTLLAYVPAHNAGFYSDDEKLVVQNERLRTRNGLAEIWSDRRGTIGLYYPLTFSTYWLEYQLWGSSPRGYHVDNVLLHAINALLVWLVFRRLRLPGAWLAAAVFALHPVHVESVVWVTERRNTLSSMFYLLSLLSYLRFRPLDDARRTGPRPAEDPFGPLLMYTLSILFFIAALLSKTVTLSLPAAIFLVTWWKRKRLGWADVWPLVPFVALGLALSLWTYGLEQNLIQKGGPGWGDYSLVDRLLIAGRAVWFYVGKVVMPVRLSFVYTRFSVDAHVWWHYLYPITAVVVPVVCFLLRRRIGKGPVVALLFYGWTLLPILGLLDYFYMTFSSVADRFLYLPSLGIVALVVSGATLGLRRIGPPVSRAGPVLCLVILISLGAGVWKRAECYENAETLYRDVLAKNPDSWFGHYSLGCVLGASGRPDEAILHLESALRLKPNYPAIRGYLGVVYSQVGRYEDALENYREALRQNPNDEVIRTNLGFTCVHMGKYDDGIEQYRKALQINPSYEPALRNLSRIVLFRINHLLDDGQTGEALRFAREARNMAVELDALGLVDQIDVLLRRNTPAQQK